MLTIILDASTGVSTAILANHDRVIARRSSTGKALTQLHPFIREVLLEASVPMSEIGRIGVIQGPGSWTGLHIAIAAAKTLAQVLKLPLIPLSFLDALAFSSQQRQEGLLGSIYSSPNGNYFFRSYEDNGDKITATSEHQKLTLSSVMEMLTMVTSPYRLIGEITTELMARIKNSGLGQISLEQISYPSDLTLIAMMNEVPDEANSFRDMMFLEPLYMQSPGEGPRLFGERR